MRFCAPRGPKTDPCDCKSPVCPPAGGAASGIHQHPGDGAVEERNPAEHRHLPAIHVGLIFLRKTRQIPAVAVCLRVGAKFCTKVPGTSMMRTGRVSPP